MLKLSDKVCDVIQSGKVCVTVGGDHAIGLGTVFGHAKAYTQQAGSEVDPFSRPTKTSISIQSRIIHVEIVPALGRRSRWYRDNRFVPPTHWVKLYYCSELSNSTQICLPQRICTGCRWAFTWRSCSRTTIASTANISNGSNHGKGVFNKRERHYLVPDPHSLRSNSRYSKGSFAFKV